MMNIIEDTEFTHEAEFLNQVKIRVNKVPNWWVRVWHFVFFGIVWRKI